MTELRLFPPLRWEDPYYYFKTPITCSSIVFPLRAETSVHALLNPILVVKLVWYPVCRSGIHGVRIGLSAVYRRLRSQSATSSGNSNAANEVQSSAVSQRKPQLQKRKHAANCSKQ